MGSGRLVEFRKAGGEGRVRHEVDWHLVEGSCMSAKALRLSIPEEFFITGNTVGRFIHSVDLSGDSEKDTVDGAQGNMKQGS